MPALALGAIVIVLMRFAFRLDNHLDFSWRTFKGKLETTAGYTRVTTGMIAKIESPLDDLKAPSSIANACKHHPATSPHVNSFAIMVHCQQGRDLMSDDLSAEFEHYRRTLRAEEEKEAFDRKIKRLLEERGVDYVRGYVDALKETILK